MADWKTLFDAPAGQDPVTLNLGLMGKGEVWVNGQSIGRYWVSFHTLKGNPSQTWYVHENNMYYSSYINALICQPISLQL